MADEEIELGGTLTLAGEITEILIEADNPGGTITPFGTLQTFVDFGVIGESIAGTITPTGELSVTTEVACFDTPFECVEVPDTEFGCIAVCEDRRNPEQPPPMMLSGLIIPVGNLILPPEPCPDCPECPECPECPDCTCPPEVTGGHLVPGGASAGDTFVPSAVSVFDRSDASSIWKAQTINGGGFVGCQWHEAGDFSASFGPTPVALNGTGHLRISVAGSFMPPGVQWTVYLRIPGYVPGQNLGVSWTTYYSNNFGGAFARATTTQTIVVDGGGDAIISFTANAGFSGGILVYEATWIEDIQIQNPLVPVCPEE